MVGFCEIERGRVARHNAFFQNATIPLKSWHPIPERPESIKLFMTMLKSTTQRFPDQELVKFR